MDIERVNATLAQAISQFQDAEIATLASDLMERASHPHAVQVEKAGKLDAIDPMVAKHLVKAGLDDKNPKDDMVPVSKKSWPAASPIPTRPRTHSILALSKPIFRGTCRTEAVQPMRQMTLDSKRFRPVLPHSVMSRPARMSMA